MSRLNSSLEIISYGKISGAVGNHSLISEELESKILEKISIVPQPLQKPHPPIWQVVDSPSSIEWAANN